MAIFAFSFHSSIGAERLLKVILYLEKEDDLEVIRRG